MSDVTVTVVKAGSYRNRVPKVLDTRLSISPSTDNTAALQALIDETPDGTEGSPSVLVLPYYSGGYRVDGMIIIDSRHNLTIRGESEARPFKAWTNLTGQEVYPHEFDEDPASHQGTADWGTNAAGDRTWRGNNGQSLRRHWIIESGDSADHESTNITLQDIQVTGPSSARQDDAGAEGYAAPDNGPNLWDSKEAEHGFAIGYSGRPVVSGINLIRCKTRDTHGDGFYVHVDHAAEAGIEITDCESQTAGRHSMTINGAWGCTVTRFLGQWAASAVFDMEPNAVASGVRGISLVDCAGHSYRIPLLIQNGGIGSLNQDITIAGYEVQAWGYHSATWYPVVGAYTNNTAPVGALTVTNMTMADGVDWNSTATALIKVADWPEVIVTGCVIGFGTDRGGYGVELTDVAANTVSGNTFSNCSAGDVSIVSTTGEIADILGDADPMQALIDAMQFDTKPDVMWGGNEASGATEIGGSGYDLTPLNLDQEQTSAILGSGDFCLFNSQTDSLSNTSDPLQFGSGSFAVLFVGALIDFSTSKYIIGDFDGTTGWAMRHTGATVDFLVRTASGVVMLQIPDHVVNEGQSLLLVRNATSLALHAFSKAGNDSTADAALFNETCNTASQKFAIGDGQLGNGTGMEWGIGAAWSGPASETLAQANNDNLIAFLEF